VELLDGRRVAAELKEEVIALAAEPHPAGPVGALAIVVGNDEASLAYTRRLETLCAEIGIGARLVTVGEDAATAEVVQRVAELGTDPEVAGIIVQQPLPAGIDSSAVTATIDPSKDVDGVTSENAGRLMLGQPAFVPATAAGVMEILRYYGIDVSGRRAVVIGRSAVVGKPLALLLLAQNATVTVCHSRTVDLPEVTRSGDLVVAAAGRPGLVTAEMIREGAVVIDVGTNFVDGRMVGDVDFEGVAEVAGALTPVPGGVGPVTNLMLLLNVLAAAGRPRRPR
jgi:methylenetetrahydrofolate dehydrogenase (NADP+) / methenyltetrahydrofolate cyclohydrolase